MIVSGPRNILSFASWLSKKTLELAARKDIEIIKEINQICEYKSPANAAAIFYLAATSEAVASGCVERIAYPLAMQICKYKSPANAAAIFYLAATSEAVASGYTK